MFNYFFKTKNQEIKENEKEIKKVVEFKEQIVKNPKVTCLLCNESIYINYKHQCHMRNNDRFLSLIL
jgi:hypothetical protein